MCCTTLRMPGRSGVLPLLLLLAAAPAAGEDDPLTALRAELTELRRDYDARISELEARIAELEGRAEAPQPPPGDELARLRAEARAAAEAAPEPAPPPAGRVPEGRLNLNRLNPEISVTGNVLGIASDVAREEFSVQELELDAQATLDPFSRMRLTLALEGEELDVEEGYVTYASLPGGLSLTGGKFRQQFGALNRQHLHALPQTDYPAVLRTFFDDEGLAQTGLSLRWLLPRPWATANELTFEVTDGSNEAFGGEDFEQPAFLAHLKSFWELGEASYFEWGLTGSAGDTADGGTSRVWGSDFTFHWQPPRRAKYREVTWRTELLFSERDDPFGVRREAWGGYSYLEGLVRRNLYVGGRLDRLEDPLDPSRESWALVPYLTWWQSEWVRLRAELQHLEDDLAAADENRFLLQLTWAAGPHKHETY